MKIVSFNIRCAYREDGINSFVYRLGAIVDKIHAEMPDVIGFQEVTEAHLAKLEPLLPEYLFVGQLRGKNYDGEGLFTAIRRDTCTLLGCEAIWLSPTPYLPGSRYEEQSLCPRILQYTLLRHKASGTVLRLLNLHLDHISEQARVLGMRAALDFLARKQAEHLFPYAILGDFNATPDAESVALCAAVAKDLTADIPVSFHDYGCEASKIDFIFCSEELSSKATAATAWTDEADGIYLSDHYPICIELSL